MNKWLADRADELAAAGRVDRSTLELAAADVDALLELARVAAHESGDRRNAPLLCYLVGAARAHGASVAELAEAVRASTS
jgi:Domain of unknown function (DUF6457)